MTVTDKRPNVLLLMTDQHRGDCLGVDGHPVLQTPYLDALAGSGIRFSRGYSACPICIPARRTLMTGLKPSSHGVVSHRFCELEEGPTLPECFGQAGYQTHLVGKIHLWPERKLYGFHSAEWADGMGISKGCQENDYQRFLRQNGVTEPDLAMAHGMNGNGWPVRPWHLDERLHITNWTATMALDFLERRDPTMPFFLKVSFFQPHQPNTPPQFYYDMHMNKNLREPARGDWSDCDEIPSCGVAVTSSRINPSPDVMKQYQAAYYGSITHIDHQIGRILNVIPDNTIIVFVADHGEMLGDHGYTRKSQAFEGAARIPFIFKFPGEMGLGQGNVIDRPVELMDVMPTLLDAAQLPLPEKMDGQSLIPLINDKSAPWREYLHGEVASTGTPLAGQRTGMQYLTDGKRKYIWYPEAQRERFFDLEHDPQELFDLAAVTEFESELAIWRKRLSAELQDRRDSINLPPAP